MIIYLAGNVYDEEKFAGRFHRWQRLLSYYYTIEQFGQFNTLLRIKKENDNDREARATSSI